MPLESDTIEAQVLEQRQESLGPEAQIDREMDREDPYPATPTQQPASQESNSSTPKPTAKNSEQAIYWARDLIL
ncbi:uncharacterized protein SETTUDRAFT_24162 [Exserohilum turcica Et28A]|uniref:Uncharacterized protein n=1 Tax=Exserohilum turcicum (strain 28A) TaxID=671987 RepID=R0I8A9_EXST2|nr:uncharacterized protein SETTUDRAFT_24162 [Exserohilum turcica Et28A]EOA81765.1 hypothetical protein SETTUDRAFT_24162 [Exserohilum turcica Et28A]